MELDRELRRHEEQCALLAGILILEQDIKLKKRRIEEEEQKKKKKKQRRKRSVWVKPWLSRRPLYGQYAKLLAELRDEDERMFRNFTRVPAELFQELETRVGPLLQKQKTFYRQPLEPGLRLALTLRYLASGDSYQSLSFNFRVAANTICIVVRETCEAIIKTYEDEVLDCPSTPEEWKKVADVFSTRWNFHHACGAVDGKHVAIRCPAKGGSVYFNYKRYHSIVLMAVVDADYQFLFIDVGTQGSAADGGIWKNCALGAALEEQRAGLPEAEPLPGETVKVPYCLVGDDAFALRPWMMKPYPSRNLSRQQRIFNYRLSRARRVVENAFGITAMRFRCLLTTMAQRPENVQTIVYTACVLHNLIRIRKDALTGALEGDRVEPETGNIIPGTWRTATVGNQVNLTGLDVTGGNTSTKTAKQQRDVLCAYYNSERGRVPWQDRMVP